MKTLYTLIIWAILLAPAIAAPTTYYVDTVNGDNGNAGTSSGAAWATIKYAIETGITRDATNGDEILIYAPSGTPDTSGTSAAIDITLYAAAASSTAPLVIKGMDSSFTNLALAYIDCGSNALIDDGNFDGLLLYYLDIDTAGGTYGFRADRNCLISNCILRYTSSGTAVLLDNQGSNIENCYFEVNSIGAGYGINGFETMSDCYVQCTDDSATAAVTGGRAITNCIIDLDSNGGGGVSNTQHVANCTVFNAAGASATGYGIDASNGSVVNCYVEGFAGSGGNGIGSSGSYVARMEHNAAYNNETDFGSNTVFANDNTSLGSSGLTNAATDDFTPTSDLIEAGGPTAWLNLSGNANAPDIGAVQPAGAGGGGVAIPPIQTP